MPADAPPPPTARLTLAQALRGLAVFVLRALAVATVVAGALTLAGAQRFWPTWIYSSFITLSCWGLTQGALHVALRVAGPGRPGWPPLPWTVGVVLLATPLGYTLGNELANLVTGWRSPGLLAVQPRQALAIVLASLLPGAGVTWFFYNRERVSRAEAEAQAAQRAAAENQLRLLESQLEPHMLFNTLANLRVLIGLDPAQAQAMLDHLIGFLRSTLAASRAGQHPLADEFARCADYLALMQVRMGPRLQVRLDLPAELATLPVPPLLLQPLVENCIRHGLEPQVAGGQITLRAWREGDRLRLQVRDSGVGLAAAASPSPGGSRFGLAQVRARLAALYGAQAGLDLSDAEGGGTVAEITLPLPVAAP